MSRRLQANLHKRLCSPRTSKGQRSRKSSRLRQQNPGQPSKQALVWLKRVRAKIKVLLLLRPNPENGVVEEVVVDEVAPAARSRKQRQSRRLPNLRQLRTSSHNPRRCRRWRVLQKDRSFSPLVYRDQGRVPGSSATTS